MRLALRKARRYKSKNPTVLRICEHSDKYIARLQEYLNGDYRTSSYHNKLVFEPKLRLIYALPFFPDRIAHHAIMNIVEPIWDNLMHYHSYSCRKGKGQHKASYQCRKYVRKYQYAAQMDISQFYVNIDHGLLKECYRHKIKDRKLLSVLDEIVDSVNVRQNNINIYRSLIDKGICTEQAEIGLHKLTTAAEANNNRPAGVAVGNLVSQWYGNLFLNDLDYAMNTAYIRFCDDILLFGNSKEELKERVERCREILNLKRLSLSKSRIFPVRLGVDFCGYKSFPEFTLVRKSTARRKINEARQLHTMSYQHARGVLAAMNGILKHANSYNLRLKLHYEAVS